MADIVRDELIAAGLGVELVSAFAARAAQLLDYPYLVLGSPTYRNGDLQKADRLYGELTLRPAPAEIAESG